MARTAPQFDSYPDSDDDFDLNLLNFPCLTIMATPQGRVVYWKNPEPTGLLDNARLVACLRDLPYQLDRPLSPIGEEEISDIALVFAILSANMATVFQVFENLPQTPEITKACARLNIAAAQTQGLRKEYSN